MTNHTIAEIAAKLTAAQKAAIMPASGQFDALPKPLVHWQRRPGHRYPSLKLTSLGYAVRAYLQEQDG